MSHAGELTSPLFFPQLDVVFSITLGKIATLTLLSNLCARRPVLEPSSPRTSSGRAASAFVLEKHGGISVSRHTQIVDDERDVGIELSKAPSVSPAPVLVLIPSSSSLKIHQYSSSPKQETSTWDNRSKAASDLDLV